MNEGAGTTSYRRDVSAGERATSQPDITLADRLVEVMVQAIAAREFAPGEKVPSESDIAATHGISRLTVREAMRSLTQKGLVSVEQGRGTFVNPSTAWSPLDPTVLAARAQFGDKDERYRAARELTETRRLIEIETAGLAAERRTTSHLASMRDTVELMRVHVEDRDRFVEADIMFHHTIMEAADNRIIIALFAPVSQLLKETRTETSKAIVDRRQALDDHDSILGAISLRDRELAERTMAAHLDKAVALIREQWTK